MRKRESKWEEGDCRVVKNTGEGKKRKHGNDLVEGTCRGNQGDTKQRDDAEGRAEQGQQRKPQLIELHYPAKA